MRSKYGLFFGVAALAATQAAACSASFTSCADATCSGSAGQGAGGEAGSAGESSAAAGEGGDSSVPILFGACTTRNAVACQASGAAQRLKCDGKEWVAGITCPGGQLCDSLTATCLDEIPDCAMAEPGQVVCRADKLLTCGPDLVTADEGMQCVGACKGGACEDPACGDGKIETGEACDDGNVASGDGCSATCTVEPVAIVLGGDSSCALSSTGVVKCWGDNTHGALGLGDTVTRGDGPGQLGTKLKAVALGTGRHATAISLTDGSACALLDNGEAKCWGKNNGGQLGTGDTADRGDAPDEMGDKLQPIAFGGGRLAKAVSIGGDHACAVLEDGSVVCWGSASQGQLGQGDKVNHFLPEELPPINIGREQSATGVSSGRSQTTCAVLDDASGECWGSEEWGALAANSTADLDPSGAIGDFPGELALLAPLNVGRGRTVKALATGLRSTCALLDNGTVKCWGSCGEGECGQETNFPVGATPADLAELLPINLGTGRTATMISAGDEHVCAVLDDSSVKCWGDNLSGDLGVGAADARGDDPGEMGDSLKAVPLRRPALQVAAGLSHSCALLDDGTVECWGANDKGQLGRSDVLSRGDSGGLAGVDLKAVDLVF